MTEKEKRAELASLWDEIQAAVDGESAEAAIARYKSFRELHGLGEREIERAPAPADLSGTDPNIQWWVAELDQYGNPTLFDGAHNCKKEAEDSIPLIRGTKTTRGQLAVARVEIHK